MEFVFPITWRLSPAAMTGCWQRIATFRTFLCISPRTCGGALCVCVGCVCVCVCVCMCVCVEAPRWVLPPIRFWHSVCCVHICRRTSTIRRYDSYATVFKIKATTAMGFNFVFNKLICYIHHALSYSLRMCLRKWHSESVRYSVYLKIYCMLLLTVCCCWDMLQVPGFLYPMITRAQLLWVCRFIYTLQTHRNTLQHSSATSGLLQCVVVRATLHCDKLHHNAGVTGFEHMTILKCFFFLQFNETEKYMAFFWTSTKVSKRAPE